MYESYSSGEILPRKRSAFKLGVLRLTKSRSYDSFSLIYVWRGDGDTDLYDAALPLGDKRMFLIRRLGDGDENIGEILLCSVSAQGTGVVYHF